MLLLTYPWNRYIIICQCVSHLFKKFQHWRLWKFNMWRVTPDWPGTWDSLAPHTIPVFVRSAKFPILSSLNPWGRPEMGGKYLVEGQIIMLETSQTKWSQCWLLTLIMPKQAENKPKKKKNKTQAYGPSLCTALLMEKANQLTKI